MMFIWIIISILIIFLISLFTVTLTYVEDVELSVLIFINEIRSLFFERRKDKIIEYATIISEVFREKLTELLKESDQVLMDRFDMNHTQLNSLKKNTKEILKNKNNILISLKDAEELMEVAGELSFVGSYKKAIATFSNPQNVIDYKKFKKRYTSRKSIKTNENEFDRLVAKKNANDIVNDFIDDSFLSMS